MSKWTLLLMICALAVPALAGTKTVPDDFATIQAAIDAAAPEDTVYIRFGTYHESLHIDKPLRVVGDSHVGVLVIGPSDDQDVVQVSTLTADKVVIESIGIASGKRGIWARGQGEVVIQDCVVSHCQVGIQLETAKATVQNCRFYSHDLTGVAVMRTSGTFEILGNQFVLCAAAIYLLEMDGVTEIANNVINIGDWGILVDKSCRNKLTVKGQANAVGLMKSGACSPAYPDNLWPDNFLDLRYGELLVRADLLYEEAKNLESAERYPEALTTYLQAESVLQDLPARIFQADVWRGIGECYINLERYRLGLTAFERARTLYEAFGCLDQAATVSTAIGIGHEALDDYDQAIANHKLAIAIFQTIGDEQGQTFALQNLANCYWGAGKFEKAIEIYHQVLPKLQEQGMKEGEVEALRTMAGSYAALGDYETALSYLEQGLRKAETPKAKSQLLAAEGGVYFLIGLNDQAIQDFEEASNFARIADQELAAKELEVLGQLYAIEDEREHAVARLVEAISIFQHLENHQAAGDALQSLGLFYMTWEEYEKARACLRNGLEEILKTKSYKQKAAAITSYLGECYYYLHDYNEAIEFLIESAKLAETIGDWNVEMDSYGFLSNCYFELGSSDDGWHYLLSAIVVGQHAANEGLVRSTTGLADLQQRLGSLYFNMNNLDDAILAWEASIAIVEQVRGRLRRAHFKSAFTGEKTNLYEKLVSTLLQVGKPEKAIAYGERAKARTLVDMMETAMALRAEVLPSGVQTASQVLKQLSSVQAVVGKPVLGGLIGASTARAGLEEAVQKTQEEYQTILDQLEQDYPVLGETLSVNPTQLSQHFQYVEGKLGQGTVALEYFVTNDETIVWVITQNGIQTASRIPITRTELTQRVRDFRKEIDSQPPSGTEMASYLKVRAQGRDLYDLLIKPVEDYIQTASRLVIVPSDILFYLPFSALCRCPGCKGEDLLGGKFLIERYPASYAPSLSSLYWPMMNSGSGKYESVLSVGNPTGNLANAEAEVKAIASLFPKFTLLLRDKATETAVKKALEENHYDAVLFSTHGLFDTKMPLLSKLVFRKGGNDDGNLYAGEILGLPFKTNLVVLSACQTALPPKLTQATGGLIVGDELQGLSQALFVAGAPAAVLTLWNVNDASTSQLMQVMYKGLMGGNSKGEALRQAQISLLHDPTYRHPYYWAPFVLYGVWK